MLEEAYRELREELILEAQVGGLLQSEAFFKLYSDAAIDSGDIEDLEYCPVLTETRPSYRIDGYNLNSEQGELVLAICDYRHDDELQPLNSQACDALFSKAFRLVEKSYDPTFVESLEDSSPAGQAALLIHEYRKGIRRIRIVIFSNARLSVRKNLVTTRYLDQVRASFSIVDFERFVAIRNSKNGADPIEIDLMESSLAPLPCLLASSVGNRYRSYLVIVPARILAEIYGAYGARLLEANVRTFLQARTKVNKGMQITLRDEPENFLAYNNGLTATASDVVVQSNDKGSFLTNISDLQIVNGGQTTASILYARDKEKTSLDSVYVQMKLSVVDQEAAEQIVPKISKFANSQNKISEADFFASHPFHLQMERMSRRIPAPPVEGSLISTKWFYERARGQYNDAQAYMTGSRRQKFQAEHPKSQKVVKTDLAKYELTFECLPYIVSRGAQKCFLDFAQRIDKKWDPDALNFSDGFFQDSMARALIFRWTDKMIGTADWYQNDRGYKAQTVTYTIAGLVHLLRDRGKVIDYRRVWNTQAVPDSLQIILERLAPRVALVLRRPPTSVRNIGEYSKNQLCWKQIQKELSENFEIEPPSNSTIDIDARKRTQKDDRQTRKIDSGIDCQTRVVQLGPDYWSEVLKFCRVKRLGTPGEFDVLKTCAQIPSRIPSEKQSAIAIRVLEKAEAEGYPG